MQGRILLWKLHIEDGSIFIDFQSEMTPSLNESLLGVIELANKRVQTCQRLVSQHAQVVTLGLIGEQHAIVFQGVSLLAERCGHVLELCLELEDVFADLRQNCTV